jgi:hypothetical protein
MPLGNGLFVDIDRRGADLFASAPHGKGKLNWGNDLRYNKYMEQDVYNVTIGRHHRLSKLFF